MNPLKHLESSSESSNKNITPLTFLIFANGRSFNSSLSLIKQKKCFIKTRLIWYSNFISDYASG